MELFKCCIFLATFVPYVISQLNNNGATTCKDDLPWCSTFSSYCSYSSTQMSCKETCGLCDCINRGCQYNCTVRESQDGNEVVTCSCPQGFTLNDDQRTCTDIDECSSSTFPCTDPRYPICNNLNGTHACLSCSAGLSDHLTYYQSNACCRKNIGGCGQNSETGTVTPSGPNLVLGRWPWTTLIDIGGRRCSGVLISHEWILTTAHCFAFSTDGESITAFVGTRTTSQADFNPNSRRITVDRVILHENYNFPNNDIALVHLDRRVENSWAVRPICMPNGQLPPQAGRCWMSGFESVFIEQGVVQDILEAPVTLHESDSCSANLGRIATDADYNNILCAKYDRRQIACPGETGGPMVCQRCDSCDWYIAGVMTFGDLCPNTANSYAAYTSIESYEGWIARNTGMRLMKNGTCASNRASWRPWNTWEACSRSCGTGSQSRTRVCWNGAAGESGCNGDSTEMKACNTHSCPRWSDFGRWSDCSESCGEGSRSRERVCLDGSIGQLGCHEGLSVEYGTCNERPCAQWAAWSNWTVCNKTCGGGRQRANRSCVGGEPGEAGCDGNVERYQQCNSEPCPSWSDWSTWGSCTPSCGRLSVRTATRRCSVENGCEGLSYKGGLCEASACPRVYTKWSACSMTCGRGEKTRQRICTVNDDDECNSEVETETCDMPACPTWSSWSELSSCNATCGTGNATRTRECLNGNTCEGDAIEVVRCATNPCATEAPCLGDQRDWCRTVPTTFCGGWVKIVQRYCQTRCGVC